MKLTGSIRMGNDNYHELVTFNRRTADFLVLQAIALFARAVPNEDMFDDDDAKFHLWLFKQCKDGTLDHQEVNEMRNQTYAREVLFDYFDYHNWAGQADYADDLVFMIAKYATPQLVEQYRDFKRAIRAYIDELSDHDMLYD